MIKVNGLNFWIDVFSGFLLETPPGWHVTISKGMDYSNEEPIWWTIPMGSPFEYDVDMWVHLSVSWALIKDTWKDCLIYVSYLNAKVERQWQAVTTYNPKSTWSYYNWLSFTEKTDPDPCDLWPWHNIMWPLCMKHVIFDLGLKYFKGKQNALKYHFCLVTLTFYLDLQGWPRCHQDTSSY